MGWYTGWWWLEHFPFTSTAIVHFIIYLCLPLISMAIFYSKLLLLLPYCVSFRGESGMDIWRPSVTVPLQTWNVHLFRCQIRQCFKCFNSFRCTANHWAISGRSHWRHWGSSMPPFPFGAAAQPALESTKSWATDAPPDWSRGVAPADVDERWWKNVVESSLKNG